MAEENTTSGADKAIAHGLLNFGSFSFRIQIGDAKGKGTWKASVNQAWISCTGVSSESEAIDYMHGTDTYIMTAPGRTMYAPVELERIYQGVDDFYAWRKEIEDGTLTTADVTIEMLNRAGKVVRQMTCVDSWPMKWEMPELNASVSEPAVEKITLAVKKVIEGGADITLEFDAFPSAPAGK